MDEDIRRQSTTYDRCGIDESIQLTGINVFQECIAPECRVKQNALLMKHFILHYTSLVDNENSPSIVQVQNGEKIEISFQHASRKKWSPALPYHQAVSQQLNH